MKKENLCLITWGALFFLCVMVSQAVAHPFVFTKLVDTNTPIPGGSRNFTFFEYYAVSGGNVAFQAGGDGGQFGIYLFDGARLTTVADYNTPIPGGSGNFTFFLSSNPVISASNVAFHGEGGSQQEGIYLFNGTTLSVVADINMPIPSGSGNFTSFDNFYNPVISDNNIALKGYGIGQCGIYLLNGTSLNKVADYNTPVPEGSGNFDSFYSLAISDGNVAFQGGGGGQLGIYLFNGTALIKVADGNTPPWSGNIPTFDVPVISGEDVAFRASNAQFSGIYLFNGTTLSTVADSNTPIPGGSGNFTSFSQPAISSGIVAFQGSEYSGQNGIYQFDGIALSKVADTNTAIPGGSGNFDFFSESAAISNGNVAFYGEGSGGKGGIYLFDGTTLSKVADTNTLIPSGSGKFAGFSDPVVDNSTVVFGAARTGLQGIYMATEIVGISVTSPDGGEAWTAGSSQTIRWTYDGNPGAFVIIELLKGGVVSRTIALSAPKGSGGSGSHNWRIPSTQVPGTDYRIRVTSTSNRAYTNTSDSDFSIAAPTITVVSPNGGETLTAGTMQTIRWSYTGNPGPYIKIQLLKGGVVKRTIASFASKGSGGSGSHNWHIPPTQMTGSDYRIRISSMTNSHYTDTSDNDFIIGQ
ncbi:MAG TPA: Ser-Thr-rich GPI-anchored membrane family protein [Thermodesulfobacteriota bacterium]|nr:Ser-Thr-rich GPI-anchored membrane family protein [Thermodesulfobacteriota bacterium]